MSNYEDVGSPPTNHDECMEEDTDIPDANREDRQTKTDLPPSGSGAHNTRAQTAGTYAATAAANATAAATAAVKAAATATMTVAAATTLAAGKTPIGVPRPTGGDRLRFGTSDPPTNPVRPSGGTTPDDINLFEHQNRFAPLRQQGSESGDQGSVDITSGILRGGSASVA